MTLLGLPNIVPGIVITDIGSVKGGVALRSYISDLEECFLNFFSPRAPLGHHSAANMIPNGSPPLCPISFSDIPSREWVGL